MRSIGIECRPLFFRCHRVIFRSFSPNQEAYLMDNGFLFLDSPVAVLLSRHVDNRFHVDQGATICLVCNT